ncbi:MAG: flavodoxin-dependent (E)-4-hydroxy-3-methylbut-2-enyl-diphosphate synthase [Fibrobacterota bacterium]
MMHRKNTRPVWVGNVQIGGDAPVSIQSMTNTVTTDVEATCRQIDDLARAGCQIVRLAVYNQAAAEAFAEIRRKTAVPLVADIHFDYRLALAAITAGADKIRINPGNIGSEDRVKAVAQAAKNAGIPIRIGVNSGSLHTKLLEKHGGPTPAALAESALIHTGLMEGFGFDDMVVSIKASDVQTTLQACEIFAEQSPYPLHLGITEAGTIRSGTVKSAVGLGAILSRGIGNTIRVSLAGDPVEEVYVAKQILRSLHLARGPQMIACPTCGRTRIDLAGLAEKVEELLLPLDKEITVAVMGCVVNGPGEAREADIGIAGGAGEGLLFKKGKTVKKVKESELLTELKKMIDGF